MIKKYFLPYNEKEQANYIYILMFYSIANYNKTTKRYDTIKYSSIKNLRDQLNNISNKTISESTLRRLLQKECYKTFLQIDSSTKTIRILNDIKKCSKFVMIHDSAAQIIMDNGDNLFATYYLYLKYYCGYSKSRKIDTTAKQFLAACGYSTNSNSYISKISEYNSILSQNGLISITKYKDNNGYERNCYQCS